MPKGNILLGPVIRPLPRKSGHINIFPCLQNQIYDIFSDKKENLRIYIPVRFFSRICLSFFHHQFSLSHFLHHHFSLSCLWISFFRLCLSRGIHNQFQIILSGSSYLITSASSVKFGSISKISPMMGFHGSDLRLIE